MFPISFDQEKGNVQGCDATGAEQAYKSTQTKMFQNPFDFLNPSNGIRVIIFTEYAPLFY